MYKSKLQELCQQRQWALPRYSSMKDGPDHNPSFKASVFLNGTSFHSSASCKSCKEAQNDAAKSAFLHFGFSSSSPAATPNPAQEVDLGFYKNLLQELTQREGLSTPEYLTTKCGVPHRPTFFSSVEVEGEAFYGKGGKSKKEAEINAAKVAYTNLIECKSIVFLINFYSFIFTSIMVPNYPCLQVRSSKLCSTKNLADEVQEMKAGEKVLANSTTSPDNSASCSKSVPVSPKEGSLSSKNVINGLQGEPLKSMSSSDLPTAVENEENAEEIKSVKAGGKVPAKYASTSSDDSASCSKAVPVSLKEGSLSSTSTHLDISALSISDSNKKDSGLRSYLLNNRFRVYPCFPDIAFPKGITVLPISEDKWVAVSLEFPNEKDD
ncbi:double-stranded RNA-binding protein 1-like [Durio zibethinus]|uniref:Double-stranded RNA-binding protein 1-like n=1 Tax=Durio zibethinus TaxID=66656 RepID=A0A6P5XJZ8_DURZI|nr:double-stranded RNA-binding protein 1-like [Durio zibethinus]